MVALNEMKARTLLPNRLLLVVLTIILSGLFLFGLSVEDEEPVLPVSFYIGTDDDSQMIEGWFSEDGLCYVFLPANEELKNIHLRKDTVFPVWLDDLQVENETTLSDISLGKKYSVTTPANSFTLVFLQSSNVATVYIQTATGSMERIHADKSYKEDVEVAVFDKAGNLNYSGKGSLKGRGNSSWNAVKKPYRLSLSENGDILHMGDAHDWLLTANYSDQTYLRNKLAFELSERSGLEWTPECEFVDVYLNGIYNGLYLLTEKIEFGEYRLVEGATDSFLCKVEYESRWDNLSNPVRTDFGRVVEIVAPDQLENEEYEFISGKIQEMEDAILYGTEEAICRILDIDSWVRRYLIDEVSANNDADVASSYFYYKEGKIHAGPVWDYDIAFGNYYSIKNPAALYSIYYDPVLDGMPYYAALYQREFFRDRVSQLYESEFLPVLDSLVETEIPALAEEIRHAAAVDVIRWDPELGWLPSSIQLIGPDPDPNCLVEYLRQRRDFLSSVWLDGEDYCFVRVELMKDNTLACYAVPRGEKFEEYSKLAALDGNVSTWTVMNTGESFDPDQRITEDLVLLQDS